MFGIRSKEERLREEELREAYHERILEALQPAAEDSDTENVDGLVTPLRESAG